MSKFKNGRMIESASFDDWFTEVMRKRFPNFADTFIDKCREAWAAAQDSYMLNQHPEVGQWRNAEAKEDKCVSFDCEYVNPPNHCNQTTFGTRSCLLNRKARAKQQHLTNGSTVPAQDPSPKLPEQIDNGVR